MTFIKLNNKLITFGGKLLSVPGEPIANSNTVAWYDSSDLSTITKDGSDYVSLWKDKLNSGRDLIQNTGVRQPKWFDTDGILFDGTNDFMRTVAFTWAQPEMIYMVFKQVTPYVGVRYIFDSDQYERGYVFTRSAPNGLAPGVRSTEPITNFQLPINTFGIMRVLFNGANSKFIINNNTPQTCTFGVYNMDGFTLAGVGPNGAGGANIQVKEIILRKVVDTTENETRIYNYLKNKYNL